MVVVEGRVELLEHAGALVRVERLLLGEVELLDLGVRVDGDGVEAVFVDAGAVDGFGLGDQAEASCSASPSVSVSLRAPSPSKSCSRQVKTTICTFCPA